MTELSHKPSPEDPNAAGPQPGTELKPDPHAPKPPRDPNRPANIVDKLKASFSLVSVIAGTLQDGELRRDGKRFELTDESARSMLRTFINSARTIVGSGQEGVK